jgi:hypothetical protein
LKIALAIIILLVVVVLLGVLVAAIVKGIKNGKIGPSAAKFFALVGILVVLGIFVLLMGVLKSMQG